MSNPVDPRRPAASPRPSVSTPRAPDRRPVPWSRRTNPRWLGRFVLVAFLVGSVWLTYYGRGERCGWHRMSFPGEPLFSSSPLIGQNFFLNGEPFFYENWPFIEQTAFFSGWTGGGLDGYCYRPYPALFATWLTPLVGTVGAFVLVDWLAWVVCAWATWQLTQHLFGDDLAALLAVGFVLGGMGAVFHTGDNNIHLPSFACYYGGVALLYASRILWAPQPWRTHLLIASFLAVAWLCYTWYTLMLIAVYLASACRHNRWYHLVAAVLLAFTAPVVWRLVFRFLGVEVVAYDIQLNLTVSLELWWRFAQDPSWEVARSYAQKISQAGLWDSPLVVLLGLVSGAWLPRDWASRWFGAVVVGLPVLGVCAVAPSCGNVPAYLTYGISIWLYCCLGRFFALGLRRGPALRVAAGLLLAVVLTTHFAWSTAHFWGWLGPIKTYIDGLSSGLCYFPYTRPTVLSMTGHEITPILFGGDRSLADAGAWMPHPYSITLEPASRSWRQAVATQAPLFGYLALLGIVAVWWWFSPPPSAPNQRARAPRVRVDTRQEVLSCPGPPAKLGPAPGLAGSPVKPPRQPAQLGRRPGRASARTSLRPVLLVAAGIIGLAIGLPTASWLTMQKLPRFVNTLGWVWFSEGAEALLSLPSGATSTYRAELSPALLSNLGREMGPEDRLCFFVGFTGITDEEQLPLVEVSVAADQADIPIRRSDNANFHFADDPRAALAALNQAKALTVRVTNRTPRPLPFWAWQRRGLRGRQYVIEPATKPPECLPAIEIRLLRPDTSIKVAGF